MKCFYMVVKLKLENCFLSLFRSCQKLMNNQLQTLILVNLNYTFEIKKGFDYQFLIY